MNKLGDSITGADVVAEFLIEHHVDTIFCITGAGNLALIDAIVATKRIKLVYSHHEQAAVMEAQGYSRVSGKVGVVLVTTGGGTVNSLTGILSAYLDSIPVLLVSGNESSFHCENMSDFRAYGVQGFDSISVAKPITKLALRVMSSQEIRSHFLLAWNSAINGRKGPVLVDFPMDLQRKLTSIEDQTSPSIVEKIEINIDQSVANTRIITECSKRLGNANRPLLYFGNGIREEQTLQLARDLVEKYKIPFCLSWSAIDLFEDSHPLNMGRIGIYGDRAANIILQKSDFLLCIGTRLAIPQIGYDRDDFGRMADRWIVDIDDVELTKFDKNQWNSICQPSYLFLEQLLSDLSKITFSDSPIDWATMARSIWKKLPRMAQIGPPVTGTHEVHSADVVEFLNTSLDDDAIIVTDVGAGLLSGHYVLRARGRQRVFTSQGLGEMGFGLPGAIGAYFANNNRQLICLNTDGAIMFNLQELQLVKHHEIPMKLFIFNNDGYSMIKISQQNLFESRIAGSDIFSGISFPSFADLAKTFGFEYCIIDNMRKFETTLKPALRSEHAVLIEVKMSPLQKYLPRLATNKLPDGTLISPPLEDLDPKIPLDDLRELLGYQPHANSFRARGLEYEPRQN